MLKRFLVISLSMIPTPFVVAETPQLIFNAAQRAYLEELGEIRLCTDPDWLPYEGVDSQGRYTGIMSDFHQLWSQKIGLPIRLIYTDSWSGALEALQAGECDVLSSAQDTPERRSFLTVTQPYIFYPLALVTEPDTDFIISIEQVLDRQFVMVEGYAGVEMLRNDYPDIAIKTVSTPQEGLKAVESGKAFAYIDTVPTINYQMIRHGITHIKISGVLDYQYSMSVGVSNRHPELLTIYNRAITYTTQSEQQAILQNWLLLDYAPAASNHWFWKILLLISGIALLVTYRYHAVRRHNKRLVYINSKLQRLSHSDQLTGIANRYSLHQRLDTEMHRNHNLDQAFSLLMIDVDLFKQINDDYGHDVGDNVIQEMAALLVSIVRQNDLVGRWGGEEFLIICPQTGHAGAVKLAEQIRQQVQAHQFSINRLLTVSIGVSEFTRGEDIKACIKRADDALYRAKRHGRNKTVHIWPSEME